MKQEMIQKSKTEEENRKALIDKFQGSLEEITKSLGIISSPPTRKWRMSYLRQLPLRKKKQQKRRDSMSSIIENYELNTPEKILKRRFDNAEDADNAKDVGDAGYAGDARDVRVSFCDFSPELTRSFRGLRVWLPLLFHGTLPFKVALQEKLQLAKVCYRKLLDAMPGSDLDCRW